MGEAVRPHREFEMWNKHIEDTMSLLEQLKGLMVELLLNFTKKIRIFLL